MHCKIEFLQDKIVKEYKYIYNKKTEDLPSNNQMHVYNLLFVILKTLLFKRIENFDKKYYIYYNV